MFCLLRYLCVSDIFSYSAFELQVCLINSVQFSSVQTRQFSALDAADCIAGSILLQLKVISLC